MSDRVCEFHDCEEPARFIYVYRCGCGCPEEMEIVTCKTHLVHWRKIATETNSGIELRIVALSG